jgi:hypothetical protein
MYRIKKIRENPTQHLEGSGNLKGASGGGTPTRTQSPSPKSSGSPVGAADTKEETAIVVAGAVAGTPCDSARRIVLVCGVGRPLDYVLDRCRVHQSFRHSVACKKVLTALSFVFLSPLTPSPGAALAAQVTMVPAASGSATRSSAWSMRRSSAHCRRQRSDGSTLRSRPG